MCTSRPTADDSGPLLSTTNAVSPSRSRVRGGTASSPVKRLATVLVNRAEPNLAALLARHFSYLVHQPATESPGSVFQAAGLPALQTEEHIPDSCLFSPTNRHTQRSAARRDFKEYAILRAQVCRQPAPMDLASSLGSRRIRTTYYTPTTRGLYGHQWNSADNGQSGACKTEE